MDIRPYLSVFYLISPNNLDQQNIENAPPRLQQYEFCLLTASIFAGQTINYSFLFLLVLTVCPTLLKPEAPPIFLCSQCTAHANHGRNAGLGRTPVSGLHFTPLHFTSLHSHPQL